MQNSPTVGVIGATGHLAPAVIRELAKHYAITAIVRNPEKARNLLPAEVKLVKADLQDVASLHSAFQGLDYLYLNLAADKESAVFQPERDGVRNVLEAIKGTSVRRILKISAIGASHPQFAKGGNVFENHVRNEGQELIRKSGVPFTFFHPTWFMDSLPLLLHQGNAVNVFKPIPHPFYWIAAEDYARMVAAAIAKEDGQNKEYVVQGPEPIAMAEAVKRYASAFTPALKVRSVPTGLLKVLGWFSPTLKSLAKAGHYFGHFEEEFVGKSTWDELGAPTVRFDEFCRRQAGRG
jgi:uncharacterized protein YbjT (DUF2867 family)